MGMNREREGRITMPYRVPHIHGDEPNTVAKVGDSLKEFPIFMGMNRNIGL